MAIKKNTKQPPVPWSPTELLYAFTGWLTTRKKPMVFGSAYGAAPIAELLGEFIKVNNLPPPGDKYPKVQVPVKTDELTNIDHVTMAVAAPPMTPADAIQHFLNKTLEMRLEDQDIAIAGFLLRIKERRQRKLSQCNQVQRDVDLDQSRNQEALWNLEKILRGDFLIVEPSKIVTNG